MAASLPPRRGRLLLLLALLLHALALGAVAAAAAAAPFRARDVLPLLPRRLAWQLMGATAHSAVDLLPSFVGTVAPGGAPAAWRGACFAENEAAIELTPGDRNRTDVGGAVLRLKVPHRAAFILSELGGIASDCCAI